MHLWQVELKYHSYTLRFKHTFHIAAGARDSTEAMFVELHHDGCTGYGEVALPPYLPDNTTTVAHYLSQVEIPQQYSLADFFSLLEKWNSGQPVYPALAALDIALHDLQGKLLNCTVRQLYNIEGNAIPETAFTIGMAPEEEMAEKLEEASGFHFFKLKLGGSDDRELVEIFRRISDAPFCTDVNRGWKDVDEAAAMCKWLEERGCVFVEQPFEKDKLNDTKKLLSMTSLPVILDESVQTVTDVEKVRDSCNGINIKLAKCGGVYQAMKMIDIAKRSGLKVFIGCMSEGSCGIAAAAQLGPLADWVDLDGPLLISNDPFKGIEYKEGRIVLTEAPGSGARPV